MGILRNVANRFGLTNSTKFERLISEDRAAAPEEYRFADEVLASFHSGGGLAPKMQAYKLVSLNRLLEAERPMSILELGSGSSTVIFAHYAARSKAKFVTIDESSEWLRNTLSMLTAFGVSEFVTPYVREKHIDIEKKTASYVDRPSVDADFVLIDGPALEIGGTKYLDAVCTDVFDMLPAPKTIVVDIRRPTVDKMANEISTLYRFTSSNILSKSPETNFNYFSIFNRI
ncbi:precorrin-6B methylase 2 [Rhizobium sp. BK619]|uniref:hypothetical protein n=1 Tax=Rhizobium sp. BK619 TaxID=2586989 RepID=UPI00160973CA|nr:hypothetical protein [Rhizobium sp. BK619]MBB3648331.1 precorrin-6B methylase 2 [Rhizobium sp. BK619]